MNGRGIPNNNALFNSASNMSNYHSMTNSMTNSNLNNGYASKGVMSSSNSLKSGFKHQERQERQTNFKVVIRVRPPLPRELQNEVAFQNIVAVDEREQCITVSENLEAVMDDEGNVIANGGTYSTHSFMFDYVYDQNSSQKKVFENTARNVVDSALQGYNATIFAYGQTGTGKTFTMEGFNREGSIEARGIIPRAIEQIFGHIQRYASPRMRFLVRASYLQIYNEQISDLLKSDRHNLTIREDKKRGVFVDGLSEWVVRSPAEIYGLMERGGAVRATGETKMNEVSSRSHAVFIVIAEQSETVYVDDHGVELSPEDFQKFMHTRGVKREQEMVKLEDHLRQSFKVGKLNLVDLAGSERVRLSGATGQRLEESKQINRSLSALGNVISALTDAKSRQHIPYRDSKLTRMLEDSLGGNCKTTMMAMISPAFESMLETISTLKFANRAKNIRNEARVNEDLDQKSLLRKYERELKSLRAELEERNKNVVDKRRLLELEEQRRRAEADKMAAIRALEARSLEFMQEKEEKKKLEQRMAMLMGQMLRGEKTAGGMGANGTHVGSPGGGPMGDNDAYEMKEQQDKLRLEYEFKLADLERERETIEEEKAQVDRYKQLLLKQRDIMIALTQRLVERDEQIMSLQDELDAYDRHHKDLEEKLDEKSALLIKFQRIAIEVNAGSPSKNEELSSALESWSRMEANRQGGATEIHVGDYDDISTYSSAQASETKASIATGTGSTEKIKGLNVLVNSQRLQISTLESQLKAASRQLDTRNKSPPAADASTLQMNLQNRSLQKRNDILVKEREAVQTIMEHKIKVLVQNVAQASFGIINMIPPSAASSGQAFSKDVVALQRLVNASIAALRNAATAGASAQENGGGGGGGGAISADATIPPGSVSGGGPPGNIPLNASSKR